MPAGRALEGRALLEPARMEFDGFGWRGMI